MVASHSEAGESPEIDGEVDIDAEDRFLERTPATVLIALSGLTFVGLGYLLDYVGLDLWAGVTGAFALVIIGIAVFGQLFVWASAYL